MELTLSDRYESRNTSKDAQCSSEPSSYVCQRNLCAKKRRQKTGTNICNEVLRSVLGIAFRNEMEVRNKNIKHSRSK
jgi:hypothetical protein